eukprot:TCONS_00054268-protein
MLFFLETIFIFSALLYVQDSEAVLSCGDPGPIYNGTIIGKANFNNGGIIRYKCNKCYDRKGPSTLMCSRWGHWSGDVPKCLPKECPPLVVSDNEKTLTGKRYGFEYQFTCEAGTVLIGRAITRCMCNGRWSSKPPVCRVPMATVPPTTQPPIHEGYCPPPEPLHNGIIQAVRFGTEEKYQVGDRVYFLCNIRYRLIGPTYRECGWHGKWDHDNPYCQKKKDEDTEPDNVASVFNLVEYCSRLFPPIDGEVMGSNQVGSFMEFRCHDGYTMVGANKTLCLRNGQWSKITPKCKPACSVHECPSNKKCVLDAITQRPTCECNLKNKCPNYRSAVCADDGRTYRNECRMKLAACTMNKDLKILHDGPCEPIPSCHIQPNKQCTKQLKKPVYRYNEEKGICEQTTQSTCHKTGFNGYWKKQDCEYYCGKTGVCTLDKDKGPCRNARPMMRWHYVPKFKTCRRFIYFGCYGNANNFATGHECFTFCTDNQVKKKRKSLA